MRLKSQSQSTLGGLDTLGEESTPQSDPCCERLRKREEFMEGSSWMGNFSIVFLEEREIHQPRNIGIYIYIYSLILVLCVYYWYDIWGLINQEQRGFWDFDGDWPANWLGIYQVISWEYENHPGIHQKPWGVQQDWWDLMGWDILWYPIMYLLVN